MENQLSTPNARQVFENEFCVLKLEDQQKYLITSNVEQCVVICARDKNLYGMLHLRPDIYLRVFCDAALESFCYNFNNKEVHLTILGGIEDKDDPELDAQCIVVSTLTKMGYGSNITQLTKQQPMKLYNVVYDGWKDKIEIEIQPSMTHDQQEKDIYGHFNVNANTPTMASRYQRSRDDFWARGRVSRI